MNKNLNRFFTCAMPIAFGLLLFLPATGWTAVLVYTSRPLWEAAVGPRSFLEDFEGFSADVDFQFIPTSAPNGFTLSHTGPTAFRNRIDVQPLQFTDGNGTKGVSTYVDADDGDTVAVLADSNLTAIGLEVSSAGSDEHAFVSVLSPGGGILATVALTNGIGDFFGFRATLGDEISQLLFQGRGGASGGEGFYVDNIAGVFVPEPSTIALTVLAFAALATRRRKSGSRKRV